MNFFTNGLFLLTQLLAQDPLRTGFHYVYQQLAPQADQSILVNDPIYQTQFKISQAQLDFEQKYGRSVFWATTGTGTGSGTGFLVGRNRHVVANVEKKCNRFDIKGTLNGVRFQTTCKEVIYCGLPEESDFCLVRMNAMEDGRELGDVFGTLALSTTLSDAHEHLTILGNTEHLFNVIAAAGTNTVHAGRNFYYFAPARSGNSGSPLVADSGQVYGIHYQREGTFNAAGEMLVEDGKIAASDMPVGFDGRYEVPNAFVSRGVTSMQMLKELSLAAPSVIAELNLGKPIAPRAIATLQPYETVPRTHFKRSKFYHTLD